jgi:hypothetical protein
VSFVELVAAGLMLLQQSNPVLADEAKLVSIRQADPTSPYAGFLDLNHPDIVWINSDNVYNPTMMRGQLAHELTHHQDWRNGLLTLQTCGEDYIQAEYRAFKAQSNWQPWADEVMLNYVRGNYHKPCEDK